MTEFLPKIMIRAMGKYAQLEVITRDKESRILLDEKTLARVILECQLILLELRKGETGGKKAV